MPSRNVGKTQVKILLKIASCQLGNKQEVILHKRLQKDFFWKNLTILGLVEELILTNFEIPRK